MIRLFSRNVSRETRSGVNIMSTWKKLNSLLATIIEWSSKWRIKDDTQWVETTKRLNWITPRAVCVPGVVHNYHSVIITPCGHLVNVHGLISPQLNPPKWPNCLNWLEWMSLNWKSICHFNGKVISDFSAHAGGALWRDLGRTSTSQPGDCRLSLFSSRGTRWLMVINRMIKLSSAKTNWCGKGA